MTNTYALYSNYSLLYFASSSKKINRLVDELTGGEVAIVGFEFERSDATVRKNQIFASGEFLDLGEVGLLVKFDKKVRINELSVSIDYSDFGGYLTQSWSFSSHKKFAKAIESSHESRYTKASNLAGKGMNYFQQAVDLYESIPGVKGLRLWFYESSYGSQSWS